MYFVDNLKHYSCFAPSIKIKMLNDMVTDTDTDDDSAGMWIATTNFHTMDITLYKRLQM